jgi:hypothetical protein
MSFSGLCRGWGRSDSFHPLAAALVMARKQWGLGLRGQPPIYTVVLFPEITGETLRPPENSVPQTIIVFRYQEIWAIDCVQSIEKKLCSCLKILQIERIPLLRCGVPVHNLPPNTMVCGTRLSGGLVGSRLSCKMLREFCNPILLLTMLSPAQLKIDYNPECEKVLRYI